MFESDPKGRARVARILAILAVYLGASWVVFQGITAVQEALSLPSWLRPVALLLLALGLGVIGATSWVQTQPRTDVRRSGRELPGSWALAPRALVGDFVAGEVPHLTWARSILGGIFALVLLFLLAGAASIFHLMNWEVLPPSSSGARPDAELGEIAVVPFDAESRDLDPWRERIVSVLSDDLTREGGFRTIDPATVLSEWREHVGAQGAADLPTALQVAVSTGARWGLVGRLRKTPSGVRILAEVFDLPSGEKVARSEVEGSDGEVAELVRTLSADLLDKLSSKPARRLNQAGGG